MIVHIYDCDNTGFPNLALLKLSAWHKTQGDEVINNFPLIRANKNYYGAVFTWSPKPPPGDYEGPDHNLPEEVEHTCPDYNGMDYSMGFLSRGCIRKCWFCSVPEKEGWIRPHSKPEEFVRHKNVMFLDNNWLASPRWESDYEWLLKNEISCDFNQGLDSRLFDKQIAERMARLKWWQPIRFACDNYTQKGPLERSVKLLRKYGYTGTPSAYVLITDIDDALDRIEFCRSLDVDPFAQPYRDKNGRVGEQERHLARWVNHKAIFKSVSWDDYKYRWGNDLSNHTNVW